MRTEVRDIEAVEADLRWLMQHNEGLTHEEVMRDMGPLVMERRQAFLEEWKDAWVRAAELEGAYWGRRAA